MPHPTRSWSRTATLAAAGWLALLSPSSPAQQPAPPALQSLYPSRPGYRQVITPYSQEFYRYVMDKCAAGRPVTTMESLTIRLMIANRTWPEPPKQTEEDRRAGRYLDQNRMSFENHIEGLRASGGKTEYDLKPVGPLESFRQYYHDRPAAQRTFAANLMMNYYKTLGIDMRSDRQRDDDRRLHEARAARAAGNTKPSARDLENAERARLDAASRAYFDGAHARQRLAERLAESRSSTRTPAALPPAPADDPAAARDRLREKLTKSRQADPAPPEDPREEPAPTTRKPAKNWEEKSREERHDDLKSNKAGAWQKLVDLLAGEEAASEPAPEQAPPAPPAPPVPGQDGLIQVTCLECGKPARINPQSPPDRCPHCKTRFVQ